MKIKIGKFEIRIERERPNKINLLSPREMHDRVTFAPEELIEAERDSIDSYIPALPPPPKEDEIEIEEARDERYYQLVQLSGRAREIAQKASRFGWKMIWHRSEEGRLRFKKGKNDLIDIWYDTMTVGTIITHPHKGRNQLFRKHQTMKDLERIFENPRVHTGEGYYAK